MLYKKKFSRTIEYIGSYSTIILGQSNKKIIACVCVYIIIIFLLINFSCNSLNSFPFYLILWGLENICASKHGLFDFCPSTGKVSASFAFEVYILSSHEYLKGRKWLGSCPLKVAICMKGIPPFFILNKYPFTWHA